jgi:hypothetical protein
MGRLGEIALEVIVGQHRAADRGNANRPLPDAQLVQHFGNQPVGDAVQTTGTVAGDHLRQGLGPLKDQFYLCVFCHLGFLLYASFLISARISSGNGTSPPILPKKLIGTRSWVANRTSSSI